MKNVLLIDWLTFSAPDMSFEGMLELLGLKEKPWSDARGSRLHYAFRVELGGISIHFTPALSDKNLNSGCCVEMSGQGCRLYEEIGCMSLQELLSFVVSSGFGLSRLDIAYDDFQGIIPIEEMAEQAMRFEFTSRLHAVQVISDCPDQDPQHVGLSVCHGSRSSRTFFRCYDKRVERRAYDLQHWVRFEMQLRAECAQGFAENPATIGEKFFGVLTHYLEYLKPTSDKNKSRWLPADWWSEFVEDAKSISIYHKADLEYNKDRLDRHIYSQNAGSIKTEILIDGVSAFLDRIMTNTKPLNDKYNRIIRSSENASAILDTLEQLDHRSDHTDWRDLLD